MSNADIKNAYELLEDACDELEFGSEVMVDNLLKQVLKILKPYVYEENDNEH